MSSETLYVYTNRIFLKQIRVLLAEHFPEQKMHFPYPYTRSLVINFKGTKFLIGIRSIEEIIQGCTQGAEKRRIL